MVVKTELETLGLNPIVVDLGEVEIKEDNINITNVKSFFIYYATP